MLRLLSLLVFITLIETAQTLKTFKSSEFCIDSAIADGLLRNCYKKIRCTEWKDFTLNELKYS